jgi:glycosyltransferase involved in cell wall biosynthesis
MTSGVVRNEASISVIIPAFNAAATIGRAIDSVVAQTRAANEIIVVDDGSQDDLAGELEKYGDRLTLIQKPNGGAGQARNVGIDRSTCELLAFLDADDYWESEALEHHADVFQKYADVGLSCALSYIESPGYPRRPQTPFSDQVYDSPIAPRGEGAFLQATRTSTPTTAIRRTALGAERFSRTLTTAEDRDLWVRVISRTHVFMSSKRIATAVLTPGSLSRCDVDRDCQAMLRVVRAYPNLLSASATRRWEARVFEGWAGVHIQNGDARMAVRPALERLVRQPWSAQGLWALLKASALALVGRG